MSGDFMLFPAGVDHSSQKLQAHESSSAVGGAEGAMLPDGSLQIMSLALSSQTMNWNQAALLEEANVKGYFARSFIYDFEWDAGFTLRFGLIYVDYKDGLKRYPKLSTLWFKKFPRKPFKY